jgi:nitrous oxidase accessory protein
VNGDTIIVDAGYYAEKKLVINKEIYLKGINYPVLDGERVYEVVAVASNNVVIEGFKITDPGQSSTQDIAGIKLYNCKNVVIRNNILGNTVFGIYALNSSRCSIVNNLISAYGKAEQMSGNGIHCWKSDSMRIIGNNITGHRDGIYFEFVTNSVIWRNVSHNNIRYGLHFMFSHNDSYISNVFKQNGSGVAVMYSHGVKMFHNHFQEKLGRCSLWIVIKRDI